MRSLIILIIVTLLVAACAACTPAPTPTSAPTAISPPTPIPGNARHGAQIFTQGVNQSPPCSSCHLVASGQIGFRLGPNLAGIGERAASSIEGMSVEDYIHQSILEPRSHVVPGYRDLMYPDYRSHLSEQDVRDLIAYLLTLEE